MWQKSVEYSKISVNSDNYTFEYVLYTHSISWYYIKYINIYVNLL